MAKGTKTIPPPPKDKGPQEVEEKDVEITGGFAHFRGTKQLRGRDRNLIKAAAMAAGPALAKMPDEVAKGKRDEETHEEAAERLGPLVTDINFTWQESLALLELRQATVVAMLASWTLDRALPTMETIGDLEGDLYDELDAAIGGVTTAVANAKDFSPTHLKNSDFGDSRSLGSPSTDKAQNPSTPSSPSDGSPTSGGSSSPEQ